VSVRVWLTGSAGMLGQAVARRLVSLGVDHQGTDREVDVTDPEAVHAQARGFSHIVNCAAYTAVDVAEDDEAAAIGVNALAVDHLGRAAALTGATLLHFSTDYVFDGEAREPYRESSPCAPRGAYGRSKLSGEEALRDLPRCYVIRTSWLFGAGGQSFVSTMLGLMREREKLRVVADQEGRPTHSRDLAEAALCLIGIAPGKTIETPAVPGLYHFANAGATSWHGFALAILEAGLERGLPLVTRDVIPVTTAAFPRPAPRPAYSVLDTSRIEAALGAPPRPWRLALDDYLSELTP
jgi:dTDP-4-dehydrorhamnose reductase